MTPTRLTLAILLATSVSLPAMSQSEGIYLSKMPEDKDLKRGQVVYVDDGKCAAGEVKEVTGGSKAKDIPRTQRCVKRPDGWPAKK